MLYSATVTVTSYDDAGEPHQRDISFGRYAEDDFGVIDARNEMCAEDAARDIMIAETIEDLEIDKIQIHEAYL